MDLSEEKELIEKAQNGDTDSFSKLYDEFYPRIFGYILRRVAILEVSQDITSETFLKCLENIKKFRWRNVSFSRWLYRIASNEIANFYRKGKRKLVSLEEAPEIADSSNLLEEICKTEEEIKKHKDFLFFQEKLLKITPKYQEVISLRFFEKKKISEIAQILGKKEGTVKSLLARGVKKLKKYCKENDSF